MKEPLDERKLSSMAEYHAAMDELIGRATRCLRLFDRQLDTTFNHPQRCERLARRAGCVDQSASRGWRGVAAGRAGAGFG